MEVKICGITNPADALLACRLGANALGFVFYKKSKRFIAPAEAAEIIDRMPPFVAKVGVFVNSTTDEINRGVKISGVDFIQLHGENDNYEFGQFQKPVIETFRVNKNFAFEKLRRSKAKYILLDAYTKDDYGGTGKSFDWEIIPPSFGKTIILSGGISCENIDYAFNKIKPAAVDLSSSVEEYPGKKSKEKLIEFFKRINYLRGK